MRVESMLAERQLHRHARARERVDGLPQRPAPGPQPTATLVLRDVKVEPGKFTMMRTRTNCSAKNGSLSYE